MVAPDFRPVKRGTHAFDARDRWNSSTALVRPRRRGRLTSRQQRTNAIASISIPHQIEYYTCLPGQSREAHASTASAPIKASRR